MLVGDIKKEKYIYYRCNHFTQKCPDPYLRQEKLIEQFVDLIASVSTTDKISNGLPMP